VTTPIRYVISKINSLFGSRSQPSPTVAIPTRRLNSSVQIVLGLAGFACWAFWLIAFKPPRKLNAAQWLNDKLQRYIFHTQITGVSDVSGAARTDVRSRDGDNGSKTMERNRKEREKDDQN